MKKIFLLLSFIFIISCEKDPIIYTLTIQSNPVEGGTFSPTSPQDYEPGSAAIISATPSAEYVFDGWTGSVTTSDQSFSMTMDADKSLTANFIKKQYPLTITIQGEGTVSENVIKAGVATDYNSGSIIELTANPSYGWEFSEWKGDLTGTENPKQITIDKPKTVTAVFVRAQFKLTIEIEGTGTVKYNGNPTTTDLEIFYDSETIVELSAFGLDGKFCSDNYSSSFEKWSGDLNGGSSTGQIKMDKDKKVKAIFDVQPLEPICLDDNGITIKAREWAEVGETGSVNGEEYTVVDRATLLTMIANGDDVTKAVTTLITNMEEIFKHKRNFNQPIGNWDVSNVISMRMMFRSAYDFNQPIGNWDVSAVEDMNYMFYYAVSFNQPIGNWNVSNVRSMISMFESASSFNQPIGNWNVSNVSGMDKMFRYASFFNQPIGDWNVSNVISMNYMFHEASNFNKSIGNWDVSAVKSMMEMFHYAVSFNQPIGNWDVSAVEDMNYMFSSASSFNQPIGNWNVSNVRDMFAMFRYARNFDKDLSKWCVSNVYSFDEFSIGSPLREYYLPIWGTCP